MSKKTDDLTSKKDADLYKEIDSLRESLRDSRTNLGADGKNVKAIREMRRQVARLQTELSRRARQTA